MQTSESEIRDETIRIMSACGWSYYLASEKDRSFYEMHARLNLGYLERRAREEARERTTSGEPT
jgi:hypothetical protein